MMNALPIFTDGPSLAGHGVMSDSYGSSGEASLSSGSDGFKDVMAKANAVLKVEPPSKQSDMDSVKTGHVFAQKDAPIINGIAAESGHEKLKQMPDERQLQQLTVWVQQLPQNVQQMLAQAVNQGDLQQLQLILQRVQISKALLNGMVKEAASAAEMQPADATDAQTGSMDMQEAQKLALAIWLMSFAGSLTQGDSSHMVPVSGLHTVNMVASVNGRQTVVQDNSLGLKALAITGLDAAAQPSIVVSGMVSGDSSGETSVADVGESVASPLESSSSLSAPQGLFPFGLLEDFRAAGLRGDSKELRSVLERMMQVNVDAGTSAPGSATAGESGAPQDLFPFGLLEDFRAAGLRGDSKELRSVLECMMQVKVDAGITPGTNAFVDFGQIKTTGSLDLPVNQDTVGAANTLDVNDSDAILQSDLQAIPVAGANQEKSAHRATKQVVFADLKESLKDFSHGFIENKDVPEGQVEPLSSLQIGVIENEIARPSEQNMENTPLNNSPELQQITGDSRMESRETLVIRRNVSVHAVTREMEDIITKGMEQGQTLPRRVVLYLDPPDLGRVRVNILLDSGNQLSVNFVAEHANVRTVLEGHMEQLRGQLVQKGMEVSQLRVEAGGFADFASPNQEFHQNTHQERWEAFNGDWHGMVSAKNITEEETRQAVPIFRSNTNGRLHLII